MRETVSWKPGNMLYPVPAVMVSAADRAGNSNIITVAWTGTVCSDPVMLYISVRPERYSYQMIKETGEFVVNLTTKKLVKAADYCGVRSGRDVDKWQDMHLTRGKGQKVSVPIIEESPVNLECRVTEVKELGTHHMFLAEVVAVNVDAAYLNETGKFELNQTELVAYSHGQYLETRKSLGSFGYSVKKPVKKQTSKTKLKLKSTPKSRNKTKSS